MNIGFLLYPTARVKIGEDSSFWIMLELLRRGHRVSYFESSELSWQKGTVCARLTPARLDRRKGYGASAPAHTATDLRSLDAIFIRKEPPFDTEYLYAMQMLDTLKDRVFVLNDPAGIALSNEKLFSLRFGRYAPESLVTGCRSTAARFIAAQKRCIVKPLDDKGGVGIFMARAGDRNLPSLLATATADGRRSLLFQRFVDADRHGDKRIVILNGEILGAFLRRPPRHDYRANLSTGGSLHRARVTAYEECMVAEIGPELNARGLYFTGIDVIGRYLTEINVTSPAGLPEIHQFERTLPERKVADFIERMTAARR